MSSASSAPPDVDPGIAGLQNLVERIGPWLLDFGNWIFGALIAFNLLILEALLTVGPVDPGVVVATAAIALALPPAVAGFFLLRLTADMRNADLEAVATQAFEEAGLAVGDPSVTKTPRESRESKRTRVVLIYAYSLLAFTVLVTFVGVTAALWHMAWWIGVLFVVMVVASQSLVVLAISQFGSGTTWLSSTKAKAPGTNPPA